MQLESMVSFVQYLLHTLCVKKGDVDCFF